MAFEIKISDDELKYLNPQARATLVKCSEEHLRAILLEAGRIEKETSSINGDPEITSSDVQDAHQIIKRGLHKPKPSKLYISAKIGSLVLPWGSAACLKFADVSHTEFWFAFGEARRGGLCGAYGEAAVCDGFGAVSQ